jgi:hypothetical protein
LVPDAGLTLGRAPEAAQATPIHLLSLFKRGFLPIYEERTINITFFSQPPVPDTRLQKFA